MDLFSTVCSLLGFILQLVCPYVQWVIRPVKRILWNLRQSEFIRAVKDEVDFKPERNKRTLMCSIREKGRQTVVFLLNLVGLSKVIRFHIMVLSNDMNFHKEILKSLGISPQNQVLSADQSDIIIAFVSIVSRVGTDIEMAVQQLPENQPVVLVVLHHTFDVNYIAPEITICKTNVLTVNFLCHEDQGVLNCLQNTKALEKTGRYLRDIKCHQTSGLL